MKAISRRYWIPFEKDIEKTYVAINSQYNYNFWYWKTLWYYWKQRTVVKPMVIKYFANKTPLQSTIEWLNIITFQTYLNVLFMNESIVASCYSLYTGNSHRPRMISTTPAILKVQCNIDILPCKHKKFPCGDMTTIWSPKRKFVKSETKLMAVSLYWFETTGLFQYEDFQPV